MFKKETEYALRGLVYIRLQNMNDHKPSIAEIAEEIVTPVHYMAKILQRMVRMGFLESTKGKNGGYMISADKGEISLKQVISAIEGPSLFNGCGFGLKHCDANNPCPLHNSYGPIRDAINKLVNEETIQSLAGTDKENLNIVLGRR